MKANFLILFLVISLQHLSQIPTAGLLRHYPFNGNATDGVTSATSIVTGATLTTDRFGIPNSAYYFNGVNNYITIPTAGIVGLNVYSYSYWIKPNLIPSNFSMVISIGESSGSGRGQAGSFGPSMVAETGGYNNGSNPLQSFITSPGAQLFLNQWSHVTVTRDMTTLQIFVNGVQIAPTNTTFALTNGQTAMYGSPNAARFGVRSNLSNTYYGGVLDDVRIYNTVLNQSQVTALYNEACSSTFPPNMLATCPSSIITLNVPITIPGSVNWFSTATSTTPVLSGTNASFFIPAAGTYSYFFEYSNCPNIRSVYSITTHPQPTVTVNSGTICAGSTFTMVPNGASSYSFSSGSNTVAPTNSTVYTVNGVNGFGCTASSAAVANIIVENAPIVSVNSGTVCKGSSFTIVPSGASTYTFSSNSNIVSPLTNSSYTVIGASPFGCVSVNTATSNVIVLEGTAISVNSGFVCEGKSFTLSPSGASNYTVLPGNSMVVSPTVNTTYTLMGASLSNGCLSSTLALIAVVPLPNPFIVAVTEICEGEESTLHAVGDDIFTWDVGSQEKYIRVKPQVTTTYTLNAVNSFGCANKSTITINVFKCVGINNTHNQFNVVNMFPNPVLDRINLTLPPSVDAYSYKILDCSGRIVKSGYLIEGLNTVLLNESNFNSGLYQIQINSSSGYMVSKKIVVQ